MPSKKSRKTRQPSSGRKKTKGSRSSKKRDYGTPVKGVAVKSGFKRAIPAPEFYKFAKFGDSVEGQFIKIEPSKKKGYSDAVVLRQLDGKTLMVPYQTAIKQAFDLNDIKPGYFVVIRFTDVIPIAGNRTFKRFQIDYKAGKL